MIWGRLYEAFWDFIALLKEMLSSRYLPFFKTLNTTTRPMVFEHEKQSSLFFCLLFCFVSSAQLPSCYFLTNVALLRIPYPQRLSAGQGAFFGYGKVSALMERRTAQLSISAPSCLHWLCVGPGRNGFHKREMSQRGKRLKTPDSWQTGTVTSIGPQRLIVS